MDDRTDAGTALDADAVVREVVIAAPPELVWPYWLEPARLVQWMGSDVEIDPRPGGALVVRYANGAVMRGEVVELTEPHRIVLTWGWEDPAEAVGPGMSRVEVSLDAVGGGTRVRVRHTGLPIGERDGHAEGWDYFLGRLVEAAG
jgi:uncharacterized protein YndB with AHSA1/START domain